MSLMDKLAKLLYLPQQQCLLCTGICSGTLCNLCERQLNDYRHYRRCCHCGRFFPLADDCEAEQSIIKIANRLPSKSSGMLHEESCRQCQAARGPLLFNCAVAPYDSVLQEPLKAFKYSGQRSLASFLGLLMANVFKDDQRYWQADCLLPVPLWSGKLQTRGFNQAQLLAEVMAAELAVPVQADLAQRCLERQVQARLNRRERQKNISGVFILGDKKQITGKKIIIIDDTYTTGSTLNELARVLYENGAAAVWGLTLLAAWAEGSA